MMIVIDGDAIEAYIDALTGFQRLLMALGCMTLIILLFFIGICLLGLGIWLYEEISERISNRRRRR